MKKLLFLALFTLIISGTAAVHAGDEKGPKKLVTDVDENVETTVFSDRMKSESDKNRIRFTGNVVAYHGSMTVK